MKNLMNRSLAFLLALAMCLSLWVFAPISEAEAATTYVANWGKRGQLATELSASAIRFYSDEGVTYSGLSSLSGASALDAVPSSDLFVQLQGIMTSQHSHETDYEETKGLYKYTDCQEGNTSKLTCIWCGAEYDSAWPYGGDPWNREHTWPKSKSLDGNDPDVDQVDEEDIMLLRPACRSENSSHSNKPYGTTTNDTYFFPNIDKGTGYDVRGDIARTMLYVYVRYGNSTYMWGASGVIQSKEVLLQWMQADPVDTWEMGRNDSVESITGTRNIFVDYPELGFKLFNTAVPSGYQTPSGGRDNSTGGSVTVKFMENGSQIRSISAAAGEAFTFPEPNSSVIAGYTFAGWVSAAVSETTARPDRIYAVGDAALAANRSYYALFTKTDNTQTGTDYVLHTGAVTEGDYMFIADSGAMSSNANKDVRRAVVAVSITDNVVCSPEADLVWHIAPVDENYYTFYNVAAGKYAVANGTANQLVLSATADDNAMWSISSTGVITNKGNQAKSVNHTLRRNGSYGFACYASTTGAQPVLYKAQTNAVIYTTSVAVATCPHARTWVEGKVAATCTSSGYSGDTICRDCGMPLQAGTVLPQLDHSFVNGRCTGCGLEEVLDPSYTLVTHETVTEGRYVLGAVRGGSYPTIYPATSTITTGNYGDWNVSTTAVTATNGMIPLAALPADAQILTLTGNNTDGFTVGFTTNGTTKYLGYTTSTTNRKLAFGSQYNNIKWKVVADPQGGVALSSMKDKYVISQNATTGNAMIRGYSSGNIYTGLYLFRETIPVARVEGVQYGSFQDAYQAAKGAYITLLADVQLDALSLDSDLFVDLNGHDLTVGSTTANGHTVTVKDSATDDYTTLGGTATLGGAAATAADGYVQVNGSFNAYSLAITHISLDALNDALGFKAKLSGNSLVQSAVTGYGFEMGAELTKTYEKSAAPADGIFTLRLRGIMAAGGGETPIRATAFVTLAGQRITTGQESATMRQAVEYANTNWSRLRPEQKTQMRILYMNYFDVIEGWLGENNNIA